ncbi:hypothetical protein I3842_01G068300 [Carya illinoinensis]|uniref:Uncharacterized protein n=1 Tax=Carya illinoinensis TaxID=32201 RepID=A0A922K346_CARIL|nr:hypothetical protein I3842_01G068300 [Carya illinoinensis]
MKQCCATHGATLTRVLHASAGCCVAKAQCPPVVHSELQWCCSRLDAASTDFAARTDHVFHTVTRYNVPSTVAWAHHLGAAPPMALRTPTGPSPLGASCSSRIQHAARRC